MAKTGDQNGKKWLKTNVKALNSYTQNKYPNLLATHDQ